MNKYLFLFLANTIFITFSSAQIQTDRPDQTESSATVGAGNLQLESGIQVMYTSYCSSAEREILLPTNLFRYGISNIVEFRIVQQIELVKSSSFSSEGIGDLQVGTKLQLLQDESINMEIAYLGHLILPTQSNLNLTSAGENERFYGSIHRLLVSHELSSTMSLGYNLGYQKFSEAGSELTYSISLAVAVNSKVGIYIESFGEIDRQNNVHYNADAGFTYLPNPNTQLDLSFGTGIDNRMNYFSMGISLLLQKQSKEIQP